MVHFESSAEHLQVNESYTKVDFKTAMASSCGYEPNSVTA